MKVSVSIITYNHERYIAQALDSVLMQRVDFTYEIVVGEDCSTDATREILLDYQKKYPDKIRLLLPTKNLGMMGNFVATLSACRGDYVALLEGDDYWISPDKLQKQVTFLDAHPECSACFHNVLMVHEGAPEKGRLFHEAPLATQFLELKDIVSAHFIPTCSTVFRTGLFAGFPDWFLEMPMADWPLHILNAEHGTYAYIDEVFASYRIHAGSIWSSKSRLLILDKTIYAGHRIGRYLNGRYPLEVTDSIRSFTFEFEIEAYEILNTQAEYCGAFVRLMRMLFMYPEKVRRIIRCFKRSLTACLRYYCAAGRKGC